MLSSSTFTSFYNRATSNKVDSKPNKTKEFHWPCLSSFRYGICGNKIQNTIMDMLNLSHLSHKLINSYQKKICLYDKQQWERSLEDHIIYRAENICNKNQSSSTTHPQHSNVNNSKSSNGTNTDSTFVAPNSMTNDLIDLDLISGAAYTMKSKSQQGWLSSFVHAIIRVLFLPLYLKWWSDRTSPRLTVLLLFLYILQVTALRIYYHRGLSSFTVQNMPSAFQSNNESYSNFSDSPNHSHQANEFADVSPTEVLMPIAMMLVLGVIQTQIVGTKNFNSMQSCSACASSSNDHSSNKNSCSLKNSAQIYAKSETAYPSQQTEYSSSPLSSAGSSVESSPVTDIKHRLHTRLTKLSKTLSENRKVADLTNNDDADDEENVKPSWVKRGKKDSNIIPKIKIHDAQKNQKIILIDDNHESGVSSYPDNPSFHRRVSQQVNHLRRFSDSKNTQSPLSKVFPKRRYSESNTVHINNSYPKQSRLQLENGVYLRKRKQFRNKLRKVPNYDTRWANFENSFNLSSLKTNSSFKGFYNNYYGNSFDSEGTISPITPIASLPGDDWPMINSDANTSEIDDEENYGSNKEYIKDSFFAFDEVSKNSSKTLREENIDSKKSNEQSDHICYHESKFADVNPKMPKISPYQPHYSSNVGKQHSPEFTSTNQNIHTSDLIPSNELKVSCSIWQHNTCQKIDLSVMDISSAIIRKVETIEHSTEYICLSIIFSITIALLPAIFRMQYLLTTNSASNGSSQHSKILNPLNSSSSTSDLIQLDFLGLLNFFLDESLFCSPSFRVRFVVLVAMFERFVLSLFYFFLLCVAERTFKQRFLYSKYFSQITRRDRAKRSQVPHFRLHKVRNLKVWLSVRSYLRRHGPHRSVDTICSTSFIIAICLLTCISLQMLKDSSDSYTSRLICWEMVFWSLALGLYIMRLMILGSRINQKYRSNLSVLITEQINLYLQLERKPHKKDALMLANHVLKLAVDLLKELESPYKISGFSANPYLYNITKVVVLSAFSAVLTEMLGFKLKLYKIKLIR